MSNGHCCSLQFCKTVDSVDDGAHSLNLCPCCILLCRIYVVEWMCISITSTKVFCKDKLWSIKSEWIQPQKLYWILSGTQFLGELFMFSTPCDYMLYYISSEIGRKDILRGFWISRGKRQSRKTKYKFPESKSSWRAMELQASRYIVQDSQLVFRFRVVQIATVFSLQCCPIQYLQFHFHSK